MTTMRKAFKHTSHYFTGELLVLLSGIISFPIFTRIFTKSEYGIMALITTTMSILGIIASGGLRPAITRFYGEYKYKTNNVEILYSTMLIFSLIFGIITAGLIYIAGHYMLRTQFVDNQLLIWVSGLVFFNTMINLALNFIRAEEKTLLYNFVIVSEKYFGLIMCLILIIYMSMRLKGLYLGLFVVDAFFACWLTMDIIRKISLRKLIFSNEVFWEVFKYGIPLLALNISAAINDFGDRYLVQYFLGLDQVAVYSVAYNISSYIRGLFVNAISLAVWPICMNLWAKSGDEETEQFLSKIVIIYVLIASPVVFGMSALGKEAIVLFASNKYSGTDQVIPYIISGVMLCGLYLPVTAGFYIKKKTKVVASLLSIAALFNIILNIYLIPIYGIKGAAIATLLSNILYLIIGKIYSNKYLNVKIYYIPIIKYIVCSSIMYIVIKYVHVPYNSPSLILIIKCLIGILCYSTLVMIIDKQTRLKVGSLISRKAETFKGA